MNAARAPERLFETPEPSVGLVIGTYGSVPYVHLQLEAWRRGCDRVPLLVHDDASPDGDALRALCARYGADFSRNDAPHGHFAGDLTAFTAGMRWADRRRLALLVKFSRRWVPRAEWVTGLQALAFVSQYATFSNAAGDLGYGFRTECLALHLPSWLGAGLLETMEGAARDARGGHVFNEAVMHDYARRVHAGNCLCNRFYETVHPPAPGREAYGAWPLLGRARRRRRPDVLWHDSHAPFEYHRLAGAYGLTEYAPADFEAVPEAPAGHL